MMAVVVKDAAPWDGRYEFPDFSFTNRELHTIKQISGIRAGELIEALDANDTAAYVGVAVVVIGRTGKTIDPNRLWDAPVGSITIDLGSGDDGVPPTTAAVEGEPNANDGSSGPGSSDGGV